MTLKKTLVVPAMLLAALTLGSPTGCVTATTSDVKSTNAADSSAGLSVSFGQDEEIEGLPTEIPYL